MSTGCHSRVACKSSRRRLPESDSTTPSVQQSYDLLLAELVEERVKPRRNRVNPRVVKRNCPSCQRNARNMGADRP